MALAVVNKGSNIGYANHGGYDGMIRDFSEPLQSQQDMASYRREDFKHHRLGGNPDGARPGS